MGILIKADFQTKLTSKLSKYRPKDKNPEYQKEIFSELFSKFPQFKAHVAAYVERNYCSVVIKDKGYHSFDILECGESRLLSGSLLEQVKSSAAQMERR